MTDRPAGSMLHGPGLVVLAAVCWGTGGLAGSLLGRVAELSPQAVSAYRVVAAAVVLVLVQLARRAGPGLLVAVRGSLRHRADAVRLLGVGCGLALFQVAYFAAVEAVGLSIATLLTLGLAPVLVTIGAVVLLGERVGARLLVALPVALGGLALLVGHQPDASPASAGVEGSGVLAGALFAATSALGYATVTLLGRSLSHRVRGEHVTTLGFVVAAVVLLPVGLLAGGMGFEAAPDAVALVLYLAVVPTALAYTAFFAGLRGTASGVASVLTLAEPLTATVLAVLLLGERLGPLQWVGAALLGAAVLVLSLRGGPRGGSRSASETVPLGTADPVP